MLRQDTCPAWDAHRYVVYLSAVCLTGGFDYTYLVVEPDRESVASSQPPLVEDGVETGTKATLSDDNNAAVAAPAVEIRRQDVCPAWDAHGHVFHSSAIYFTGGRNDTYLVVEPDRETAASSQPLLAEDGMDTGASSQPFLVEGGVEGTDSSQPPSGEGEEKPARLRLTPLLPLVEGEVLSAKNGREVRCRDRVVNGHG